MSESTKISASSALIALDHLDDFARMNNIVPSGPCAVLFDFIMQYADEESVRQDETCKSIIAFFTERYK